MHVPTVARWKSPSGLCWRRSSLITGWEDLKSTTVELLHTPPYSPAFNPAECLIHWVCQDVLYHLPCTFTLQDKGHQALPCKNLLLRTADSCLLPFERDGAAWLALRPSKERAAQTA